MYPHSHNDLFIQLFIFLLVLQFNCAYLCVFKINGKQYVLHEIVKHAIYSCAAFQRTKWTEQIRPFYWKIKYGGFNWVLIRAKSFIRNYLQNKGNNIEKCISVIDKQFWIQPLVNILLITNSHEFSKHLRYTCFRYYFQSFNQSSFSETKAQHFTQEIAVVWMQEYIIVACITSQQSLFILCDIEFQLIYSINSDEKSETFWKSIVSRREYLWIHNFRQLSDWC